MNWVLAIHVLLAWQWSMYLGMLYCTSQPMQFMEWLVMLCVTMVCDAYFSNSYLNWGAPFLQVTHNTIQGGSRWSQVQGLHLLPVFMFNYHGFLQNTVMSNILFSQSWWSFSVRCLACTSEIQCPVFPIGTEWLLKQSEPIQSKHWKNEENIILY